MKIVDMFDAVRDGTYDDFIRLYTGNINALHKYSGFNLLQLAVASNSKLEEKIKIVMFLIKEGIDINFVEKKRLRNALHILYFFMTNTSAKYLYSITKILVENGIDLNAQDKYGSIPLKYAIFSVKNPTEDMMEIYQYLIENGSDYNIKNNYGESCKDSAREISRRNALLPLMPKENDTEDEPIKAESKIKNDDYGGFIVSKNILIGEPIKYSFREKSKFPEFNGWTLYSIRDDEEYVSEGDNFVILNATSVYEIAPIMLEIFDAPYGTDICWLYEDDNHVGFYDLIADRETTAEEILVDGRTGNAVGLYIYAGTLTRYYAKNWKTVWCQEEETAPEEIQEEVQRWRNNFLSALKKTNKKDYAPWHEDNEKSYFMDKPGWMALGAMLLVAACHLYGEPVPKTILDKWDFLAHPLIERLSQDKEQLWSLFRNVTWWVPLTDSFVVTVPSGNDKRTMIGTIAGLRDELEQINDMAWQADEETIYRWSETEGYPVEGERNSDDFSNMSNVQKNTKYDTQSLAKFCYSIFCRALKFAEENQVPVVLIC